MNSLLERLRQYASEHKPSSRELATQLGIPYSTVKSWLGPKPEKTISASHAQTVHAFLGGGTNLLVAKLQVEQPQKPQGRPHVSSPWQADAQHRARKLKMLLLLLEDELSWFRDERPESRETYRTELDPYDIGYISSLLSMLTDEEKFQRWRLLSSYRFHSFRRRVKGDGT